MSEEQKPIQYTPALDDKPHVLMIPREVFVFGAASLVGGVILQSTLATLHIALPLIPAIGLWLGTSICYWILLGSQPWKVMGALHRDKLRVNANLKTENNIATGIKRRIGKSKTIGPKSAKRKVNAAEDDIDIAAVIDFQLDPSCGAYLLQREGKLQVVWVFDSDGIPSTITSEQARVSAEKIQEGFRDLRIGDPLTMHMGSFANCDDRVREINRQGDHCPNDPITFILYWIRRRVRALQKRGKYQPKFLHFYIQHNLGAMGRHLDPFASTVQSIIDWWDERRKGQHLDRRLHESLISAYDESFTHYRNFFNKCSLNVRPMTPEQVWAVAYRRFNAGEPPPIPQVIVVTRNGITAQRNDQRAISSVLLQNTPDYGKSAVWLPGRQLYAGGVVLNSRPNREYHPKTGRLDQLLDAASPIMGDRHSIQPDALANLEIVATFEAEPQRGVLKTSQRNTGQSNQSLVMTENRKRLDGGAIYNTRKSLEAEMKLREGGHTLKAGWMAIIYRKNKRSLDRALQQLASIPIFAGDKVMREVGYFDSLFLEALPLTTSVLLKGSLSKLTEKFDRQMRETTAAAIGFMPLVMDSRPDKRGVEFISRAGSPLKVDPFGRKPHNHMVIMGETRAGKSLLVQANVSYVLSLPNTQVVIIDAGREDGTGSFDTFTKFVESSHFDAGSDYFNIFQKPDPSIMREEQQDLAEGLFKKFLVGALKNLTTTRDDTATLIQFYTDILTNLVAAYLSEPSVEKAYEQAYADGFGSVAWGEMPCLRKFVDYLSLSKLPADLQSEDAEKAILRIKMSLVALMQRQAGKAISQPSTFQVDKPLVVYALGSVQNDADMVPALLAAQASMLNQTFTRKRTWVVAEESTNLWRFEGYRGIVSEWFTGKAKSGVWACWVGQSLNILLQHTDEASAVLDNVGTYLVGAIKDTAIKDLQAIGFNPEIARFCADSDFNPDRDNPPLEFASQWLIRTGGRYHFGYHYPDFASFGLTMNDLDEVELRERLFAEYSGTDKYEQAKAVALYLQQKSEDQKVIDDA
ncbi:MAG: hypothetical protein HC851_20270 [Acaryochloris sp. RU_4_1]|nr:hypothetical protein [Acaryochloris sp. RU_4_1]NJR56196.1 hypothetical protein [Acaryochloris sp. CRU_2_0]